MSPAAENNLIVDVASNLLKSNSSNTFGELLSGLRGHRIQVSDRSFKYDGQIVAVELQSSVENGVLRDIEVLTIKNMVGFEQIPLRSSLMISFVDIDLQDRFQAALDRLANSKQVRQSSHLTLTRKQPGLSAFLFQHETAPWKTSYRIAHIDGQYTLIASAVVDNTTGTDWNDVELTLVVDDPLVFHAPLGRIHANQRDSLALPSPFSQSPPFLAAGVRRDPERLMIVGGDAGDTPPDRQSGAQNDFSGSMMGGMGRMMGGMIGGSASETTRPSSNGTASSTADIARENRMSKRLGFSFAASDQFREIRGQRVHIRLPKISIPAGKSETVFLPHIPSKVEVVRVYVPSVSKIHPLAAFRIMLEDEFQLPGGPGTVWTDVGYAGDIMLPRLVAGIPQMVTYAVDSMIEIKSTIDEDRVLPTVWTLDKQDDVLATTPIERNIHYAIENRSTEDRIVVIEHPRPEQEWKVEVKRAVAELLDDFLRSEMRIARNSTETLHIVETKKRHHLMRQGNVTRSELESAIASETVSDPVRERLSTWLENVKRAQQLLEKRNKLSESRVNVHQEQSRIKSLMIALNRDDTLHSRYLAKLATLEDILETLNQEFIHLDQANPIENQN